MSKLIKCSACNKEISSNTEKCPHCGEPTPKKTSIMTWIVVGAIVLLFISTIGGGGESDSSSKKTTTSNAPSVKYNQKYYYDKTNNYKAIGWIQKGQKAIKSRLKDSSTAEFRNLYFIRKAKTIMACGEVNAKNSFGGYGGFKRFFYGGEGFTFMESDFAAGEFQTSWNTVCE